MNKFNSKLCQEVQLGYICIMLDLVSKLVNLLLKEHPKNIHINALSIISINSELILHSIQDTA